MSCGLISGFLALANGRRVLGGSKPSASRVPPFLLYDTAIQCKNGDMIPATFRYYAPPSENPFPDNSVVETTAKFHIAPNETAHLDAIKHAVVPGDPSLDTYEDGIPDVPFPSVFVVANVSGPVSSSPDGKSRTFTVSVGEYVRESLRFTTVEVLIDGRPRWVNTPSPSQASCIGFFAVCDAYLPSGILRVSLDHVALNIRPHEIITINDNTTHSSPQTPKKHKFAAIATLSSPSTTVSSTTPSSAVSGPPPSAAGPSTPTPKSKAKRVTR
ncbi:hypothetical protein BKA70DRAFT_1026189, partial [Coprinopsis sp. MPI-PUGE-AT-0042]